MKIKKKIYENIISKQFNYGLGLLKLILSFTVVRSHNFNYNSTKNKILLYLFRKRRTHVPSFFIMSFYFIHKDLLSSNIKIYLKRIERLLIPYILWPIIIYILNNYILNNYIVLNKYSINNLKNQLLIGNGIMSIFWFQWNLFILTTLFFIIIYLCKKFHIFLIQIFGCFAYSIQYSGYNKMFTGYLKGEKRLTLGRFMVSVPYTCTGFTLASFKILNAIQNYKIQTLFFSIYIFYSLEKYPIFFELIDENSYTGILYNVRAICLIFIFSLFPSDKISNIKIKKILRYITNYTAGVYYLHTPIIKYFKFFIDPIKKGNIFGLFIIYLICYFICFVGILLFGKTKLKNLFS